MKKLMTLCTVLLLSVCHSQTVTLSYQDTKAVSPYQFDKFVFTHNLFADAFYMTGLNELVDETTMHSVLENVRTKLGPENAVKIEIDNGNTTPTITFSVVDTPKDGKIIVMATNFEPVSRTFKKDKNNLVRWYFIKDGLIVYRKNLFSAEKEKELIDANDKTGLIDFYLFDEVKENDAKAKALIDDLLKNTATEEKTNILYAYLYLQEYYLLNNNLKEAEKANTELEKYFNTYRGSDIDENYVLLPNMAKTELNLMKM